METLIEQIEALKRKHNVYTITIDSGYNDAISDVLDLIQSLPVIKAKAVRQKDTKKWLWNDDGKWEVSEGQLPDIYFDDVLNEKYIPKNAELVSLSIIIEEGGER